MNNRRKQLMLASAKEYCKCVVEGKTLKYNQIVKNGNFNGTSEWTSSSGTFSVSDNICSFNATIQNGDIRTIVYYDIVVGHKYLVYAEIKTTSATNNSVALYFGYSSPDRIGFVPNNTEWNAVCGIKEATAQGNSYLVFIRDFRASDRDTIYIKNVMCIDLTKLGLDNVNSVADFYETDLGKYIAKGNYLPYEPNGKFIHAQSPIKFKGANLLSLNRTEGTLSGFSNSNPRSFQSDKYYLGVSANNYYVGANAILDFEKTDTGVKFKTTNTGYGMALPILIKPNKRYRLSFDSENDNRYRIGWYDENGNFLSFDANNTGIFNSPEKAYWGVIVLAPSNTNITTYSNIVFYENIWDENWEVGSISTGSGDNSATNNNIRSADYIKIEPNQSYYFVSLSHHCSAFFYGKNKEYLGDAYIIGDLYNSNFVSPKTAYYMRFYTWEGNIYNNDIGIFYYDYQRYCNNSVFESGLTLQKGDKYKTYSVDEISYNNLIPNANQDYVNSNIDTRATIILSIYDYTNNISVFAKGISIVGFYEFTFTSNTTNGATIYNSGVSINQNFAENISLANGHKYYLSLKVSSCDASFVGGLRIANLRLIDLTELGLTDLTDKLRIFLQKNYKLPYTMTNKTIKDQIVRTMVEIDLSTLSWTWTDFFGSGKEFWVADLSAYGLKTYGSNVPPNAICDTHKILNVDTTTPWEQNSIVFVTDSTNIRVISSDSQNAPTGHLLAEMETPTLEMWQPVIVNNYREFSATEYTDIYRLDRDFSEYGVVGTYADTGTRKSSLSRLDDDGEDGDYCFENGYIYQKSNDIENAWEYKIKISSAPSRMVSRRIINVESENKIDMDFTKE